MSDTVYNAVIVRLEVQGCPKDLGGRVEWLKSNPELALKILRGTRFVGPDFIRTFLSMHNLRMVERIIPMESK